MRREDGGRLRRGHHLLLRGSSEYTLAFFRPLPSFRKVVLHMLKSMRESFHQLKWILLAVVAAFIIGFVYVDMGLGGANQRTTTQDKSFAARVNGDTITFA